MASIVSFFVIILVSLLVVRVAAIMLKLTGMSDDIAKFQARSAFTTTGFTSRETESIVNHPVRRKIILNLMLLGNVGLVSFMSSLIITFVQPSTDTDLLLRVAIIVGGLLVLYLISRSRLLDRVLSRIIERFLRRFTRVYAKDYDSLLFLSGEFEIVKLPVREGNWLAGRTVAELQLSDEGVLIIGVQRGDGYYVGVPRGSTSIYEGDEVILYGREEVIRGLSDRPVGEAGDTQHLQAVEVQRVFEGKPKQKQDKSRSLFGRVFSRGRG
ncbi:TrkA C-terminal domain-containing protein [Spirochaeta lutea]|uniref:Potassium transporter TrkA n=1 Tax=Spirochaeta lutea TaxID=1480694 RepID=A0A098R0X3_9SPIO|nr:TrkA C-terminal domain-containing protein [Spirochaeta lutea]KGE73411.1 potassium transporter TrkA [Spirochaeta lutea]